MSEEIRYNGWRPIRPHRPDFNAEEPVEPTRFFDQLCYIGDHSVCCYLLETSEGCVLIDAMWPRERYAELLKDGIKELGHELSDVKHIVLTHAHEDHYGIADWFREQFGTKIYLSEIDNAYGKDPDQIPGMPPLAPLPWDADVLLQDGDVLTFGDATIECVLTPGHTPGCMNYVIDVTDCGSPQGDAVGRHGRNALDRPRRVHGVGGQVRGRLREARGGLLRVQPPLRRFGLPKARDHPPHGGRREQPVRVVA